MESAILVEHPDSMADFLLVIRSGKTAYDQEGRIKGTLDLPLSEAGLQEARAFAEKVASLSDSNASLLPRRLFSSSARCSMETAAIIGSRIRLKPRICRGLENLDHGLWQGLRVEEIQERQPRLHRQWQDNPWSVVPPEGEVLEECCDRVAAALERLARRHQGGGIAVVVPEPLERIIRWVVAGEPLGDLWECDGGGESVFSLPLAAQWSHPPRPARAGSLEMALRSRGWSA